MLKTVLKSEALALHDVGLWTNKLCSLLVIKVMDSLSSGFLSYSESEVKVEVSQPCLTLCDPIDDTVHGLLQARILEWVAFPFSRGSSQPRDQTQVSCFAGRFFTNWATREAQEYWSGQPIPSPVDLPNQKLNQGLLHCRWILYQLSYQGSPLL